MNTEVALPRLGQRILVVINSSAAFMDICRAVTTSLPDISSKSFTLLCCCPTHYWEHSGAENADVKHELEEMSREEQAEFGYADTCLKKAHAIFRAAGIPTSQIAAKIAVEDSLLDATMTELKRDAYSGVIVSSSQGDIVNRLQGKGITDLLRHTPKVEVWAIPSVP